MLHLAGKPSSSPCDIDPIGNCCKLGCATKTRTTGCRTVGLLGVLLSILETLEYPACLTLKEITVLILLDRKDPASGNIIPNSLTYACRQARRHRCRTMTCVHLALLLGPRNCLANWRLSCWVASLRFLPTRYENLSSLDWCKVRKALSSSGMPE